MMVHGLAVRRGDVTTLCNGRSNLNENAEEKNRYIGDPEVLHDYLIKTSESASKDVGKKYQLRVMIPQEMLANKVTCRKCRAFMTPSLKKDWMNRIRRFSPTYNENATSKPAKTGRMIVLGKRPVGRPRKHKEWEGHCHEPVKNREVSKEVFPPRLTIPQGKSLVLTISIV